VREGRIDFRRSCSGVAPAFQAARFAPLVRSIFLLARSCRRRASVHRGEKRRKEFQPPRIFRVPKIATRSYVSAVFRQWPGLASVFNSGDAPASRRVRKLRASKFVAGKSRRSLTPIRGDQRGETIAGRGHSIASRNMARSTSLFRTPRR